LSFVGTVPLRRETKSPMKPESKELTNYYKIASLRGFERYGLWLLKNSRFQESRENFGERKCLAEQRKSFLGT